ncbi:MAG: ABC transporter ATP-binding protein [Chloroflexi bacterium]|nr:ABC transporter ATP-binding protein [Chloroflexota bacterium]
MSASMSPMLEIANLEVRRNGLTVLTVPDLKVRRGETLVIIGPNGAGKSTLLLSMALLLQPASGVVKLAGETARRDNALRLRSRMAVVFQESLLLDTSVGENVAIGLKLREIPPAERDRRVAIWLDRFGIAHLARRPARSLSGGEAQRTTLARAFVLEPQVLLLDEPFLALDAPTRVAVTTDLLAALRGTGITTVLVTHDLAEALALGDRVGVLIGGRIRQVGPPEEVFGAPADADVAGFLGVATIVPGLVTAQDQGLAHVRVGPYFAEVVSPLAPATPVLMCLRPEDVTLHPEGEAHRSSARNCLPGAVTGLTPAIGHVRVSVDCGFPVIAAVTRRSVEELGLAAGTPVVACFKATAAHLISRVERREK